MVRQFEPGSVAATVTAMEVTRVTETVLPTRHGVFQVTGYRDAAGTEHVALARGLDGRTHQPDGTPGRAPLVRVHSECLTGDAFGSWRCDCGDQLDAALAAVAEEELGVVVYVRGHEGRGIGLLAKLKAYALQDRGVDTVDANTALGLPVDARQYDQAARILQDLGVSSIRLLSGNPAKEEALSALGITVVERRGLPVAQRPENAGYLTTKRERMRHDIVPRGNTWDGLLAGEVPVAAGPDDDLVHRYGRLASTRGDLTMGYVRQSLDGFALPAPDPADFTSHTSMSGALVHAQRLHALVDAVVEDADTFLERGSGTGSIPGTNPLRVVLDAEAAIGQDAWAQVDVSTPTLWVVGSGAVPDGTDPPRSVDMVRLPASHPSEVLAHLRARGLARVLVEGRAVSRFLDAGLLDTLQLVTSPVLLGGGEPGLRLPGAAARTVAVRHFLLDQDACTELDLTSDR